MQGKTGTLARPLELTKATELFIRFRDATTALQVRFVIPGGRFGYLVVVVVVVVVFTLNISFNPTSISSTPSVRLDSSCQRYRNNVVTDRETEKTKNRNNRELTKVPGGQIKC